MTASANWRRRGARSPVRDALPSRGPGFPRSRLGDEPLHRSVVISLLFQANGRLRPTTWVHRQPTVIPETGLTAYVASAAPGSARCTIPRSSADRGKICLVTDTKG